MSMSRVLLTGGSGFIGRHVAAMLMSEGLEYDNCDLQAGCDFSEAVFAPNKYDVAILLAAMGGVNHAAKNPYEVLTNNVGCCARLRSHPYPLRRVILVSSFSVYGNPTKLPVTEETPTNPLETYAASKLMQELCFRGSELPATILRLSSVYGRGMRLDDPEATIIARLAGWISRGEKPQLHEDGLQTRDFVYVGDVVEAIRRLIRNANPREDPIVNVCSGTATSLIEAVTHLEYAFGKQDLGYELTGKKQPGYMRHCQGDPTKLTHLLGHPPTQFREGACAAFS